MELDVEKLLSLAKEWYESVPDDMKDKVVVANYSIKPISFTPKQIISKIESAARKSKTKEDFLKESGLCSEFLETLEKMYKRRIKSKEGGKK